MGLVQTLFGRPTQRVTINPRTQRPYTRNEIARIQYERAYFREYGRRPPAQRPMQMRPIQSAKPRSGLNQFFGEMFSTNYNGPMPNNQRQNNSARKGPGIMTRMRQSAMWTQILRR